MELYIILPVMCNVFGNYLHINCFVWRFFVHLLKHSTQQTRNVPVALAEGYNYVITVTVTFPHVTLMERKENFPPNVTRTLPANVIVT